MPASHASRVPVLADPNGEDFDRRAGHRPTVAVEDRSLQRHVVEREPQHAVFFPALTLHAAEGTPDEFRPIDRQATGRFKPVGRPGSEAETLLRRHQHADRRVGRLEHVGKAALGPRELKLPLRIAHRVGRRRLSRRPGERVIKPHLRPGHRFPVWIDNGAGKSISRRIRRGPYRRLDTNAEHDRGHARHRQTCGSLANRAAPRKTKP